MGKKLRSASQGQTVKEKLADVRDAIREGCFDDVLGVLDRTMRRARDLAYVAEMVPDTRRGEKTAHLRRCAEEHAELAAGIALLLWPAAKERT